MRCVKAAGLVAVECAPAAGRVARACCVELEGIRTDGRVDDSGSIATEGNDPVGCIAATRCIAR